MITGFNGRVLLTWTSAYYGVIWLMAGMACTLLTRRRGLIVAVVMPILVSLLPTIFTVNAPGPNPTFQFFRFGGDLSVYWNTAIIPFFASLVGALLGELISPSEEE